MHSFKIFFIKILKFFLSPIKWEIKFLLNFSKKIPSLLIAAKINLDNKKLVCKVCDRVYLYESKKIFYLSSEKLVSSNLLFKDILGYTVIPKACYDALDIAKVTKASKCRMKNLFINQDLLASEIIKYAHALDKGLRMPNKRKVFGREKSDFLEMLLIKWASKFTIDHPIYKWAKGLLFEYWIDQDLYKNKYSSYAKKEQKNHVT